MAILVPGGLKIQAAEPVDTKVVLTKQQMKDVTDIVMPEAYFAICSEDFNLYIYNKNISDTEAAASATGRFVLAAGSEYLAKHYVHTQSGSQAIWTIEHNLGKQPSVTVINSSGDEVWGDITYNNLNKLTINFNGTSMSGYAYLN